MAGPDGAFDRRRQAGCGPVSGQKQVAPLRPRRRPPGVLLRGRGEGRPALAHDLPGGQFRRKAGRLSDLAPDRLRQIVARGLDEPVAIGIVLSVGVALFARAVGLDRDRAFYPTVMIVIASYYVLFAVMSGSVQAVVIESVVMALFAAAAVAGFRSNAWIVVAALAGHGAFDAFHGQVIQNAGVPTWWPAWCFAYDVGAAACLGWFLRPGLARNDATARGVLPAPRH